MLTGFIFTNTRRLAEILSCPVASIHEALNEYISSCSTFVEWNVIDMADDMYSDVEKRDWHSCSSVLNDYYYGLGLQKSINCPLFIIGGDDVIPMPLVKNPLSSIGGEYLYSDMLYCFDGTDHFELGSLVSSKPRLAVGRLPINNDWDINTLMAYLNDSVDYIKGGIHIRGAAMTTTQSWLRASKEMMRDIPAASLSEDYVPLNERMIVSPDLDTQYQDMYDGYVHELKKVDFLVCNLHGSIDMEVPFFIGEDKEQSRYYIAVQPSMMEQTTPIIFNTVACYGARYIGYGTETSMLMSSMAYGTMLYCGSCDTAIGGYEKEGRSELLMKLYNIYLHKGFPAGMALLKAKQDYYRTCHNEDNDEYAMFTILEFNLFGCPLLYMQPKLPMDYKPLLLGNPIIEKQGYVNYRPKHYEPAGQSAFQADDIHAYVRSLVDNNLSEIQQKVEKEVYRRLGLGADKLHRVLTVSSDAQKIGYQFVYKFAPDHSIPRFETYCLVNTDKQGDITQIIHTK